MTIPLNLSAFFFSDFAPFSSIILFSRRRMSICISWMKNTWCSPLINSFSCGEQIAMAFNAELILDKWRSYGDWYEEKKKNIVKCKSRTRAHFVFLSLSCINAFNGFGLWTIWIKRGAANMGNFILSYFFFCCCCCCYVFVLRRNEYQICSSANNDKMKWMPETSIDTRHILWWIFLHSFFFLHFIFSFAVNSFFRSFFCFRFFALVSWFIRGTIYLHIESSTDD